MDRKLDWRAFVNRLAFCYGCGRFGIPVRGKSLPRGWGVLYQPHAGAPPGLHVCSEACKEKVRAKMTEGPITEPLAVAQDVVMSAELREEMMVEAMTYALQQEGAVDETFAKALGEVLTREPENDGSEEEA